MEQENQVSEDRGDFYDPFKDEAQAQETEVEAKTQETEVEAKTQETEVEAKTQETEVEAKVEAEAQETEDKKGKFIPKDRFDEAVRKERLEKEQLAARIKGYEEQEAQRNMAVDMQSAMAKVKELVKSHTNLLADGELDKASDVMEQIISIQTDMSIQKAEAAAGQAKTQAKQEVQYDALVARLEAEYPEINPDSPDFDASAVRKVQLYMTGLIQGERLDPNKALQEAIDTIIKPIHKSKEVVSPAPEVAEAGMRRKESAVTKAMDANTKQPSSTSDVGKDHDKEGGALDSSAVMKMSWDEFIKLPDTKLSELRGDFIN